jgi:CheY-like chemotaxis protein
VANVRSAVSEPARILVVDDDAELRRALAEVLTDVGYVVSCAPNGEEALRELRRAPAPDAIVLDLAMPVMDGWTFRARQRSDPALAPIPTIVVSASRSGDARLVGRLAPDAFLAKPFDLDQLIETVCRVCASRDAANEPAGIPAPQGGAHAAPAPGA